MEVTDKLSREQLNNQTITPNQTVSGTVYFMVSEVDGRLDEPKLKVGIIDPSQKMGYETTLNMTTGAATGGTLHLAGLKPLETFTDKPVLDAATVDITAGTYVSVIQGAPPYVFPNRSPMITFKQSGENIIGTNVSRKSLKIIGTRKGDTIKFKFGNDVTGVWKINPDGTRLKGNFEYDGFYPSRGIWNLTKVE